MNRSFIKPFRLLKAQQLLTIDNPRILDVGSGSHSASITKAWIPACHYTGVDITRDYDNDEADHRAMDAFFEMDVTALDFGAIPDGTYDLIILSHIVEHLHNGDRVIAGLTSKLKDGGIMYVEFPSERSVTFPSMRETLNFYDDPTHCRIYTVNEVSTLLRTLGLEIMSSGVRRQWINIALMPAKIVVQLLTKGYVRAGVFWDAYGFAEYVIARRRGPNL